MQIEIGDAILIYLGGQFLNTLIAAKVAKTELRDLKDSLTEVKDKFEEAHSALMQVVHDHDKRISVVEDRVSGPRRRHGES